MKPSTYLETSVIGAYLDNGEPFRRDLTIRWWEHELSEYRAVISPLVTSELGRVTEPHRSAYLKLVDGLEQVDRVRVPRPAQVDDDIGQGFELCWEFRANGQPAKRPHRRSAEVRVTARTRCARSGAWCWADVTRHEPTCCRNGFQTEVTIGSP